jgi:hypothetical protein
MQEWKEFHRDNKGVFDLFKMFGEEALGTGRNRFGGRMLGERVRWYTQIQTTDPDYKICNNHFPYYTRLLIGLDRRFEGVFTMKDIGWTVEDVVAAHKEVFPE